MMQHADPYTGILPDHTGANRHALPNSSQRSHDSTYGVTVQIHTRHFPSHDSHSVIGWHIPQPFIVLTGRIAEHSVA